jgi:hypothetical protein
LTASGNLFNNSPNMRIRGIAWLVPAVLVMGSFRPGVGQSNDTSAKQQSVPDAALYEFFFRDVVESASNSGPVPIRVSPALLLNGAPTALRQTTAQEILSLTDQEARALNTVAADCTTKIRSYDRSIGPSLFAARLELIQSQSGKDATQALKDLTSARNAIVLAHLSELKTALGESRFQTVDSYVHTKRNGESSLPLVPIDK